MESATETSGAALPVTDAARSRTAIPRRADVFVYDGPHPAHPGTTCPDAFTRSTTVSAQSLRKATDANHAFLGAFIARVLDR